MLLVNDYLGGLGSLLTGLWVSVIFDENKSNFYDSKCGMLKMLPPEILIPRICES